MTPPISIDGTDITGATIDGTDVTEITVDGQTVFVAVPPATTVTSRGPDNSSTAISDERGLVIEPKIRLSRIGARVSNLTTGADTVFLRDANLNLIASKSLSGNSNETFDFKHDFTANTEFIFSISGGTFNSGTKTAGTGVSYPITGQEIDINAFIIVDTNTRFFANVQCLNDFGKTNF